MESVFCDYCNREFKRKKSQLKLAVKHYCSMNCARQGSRKGKVVECFECKKLVYKSLKALKTSISQNYFCSRSCSNIWIGKQQRVENNPNWSGGASSYKNIFSRTNTKKMCILCKKYNSRILCVHHVDRNRKNNSINNLVWLCMNCHFLVHNYKKETYELFEKLKI